MKRLGPSSVLKKETFCERSKRRFKQRKEEWKQLQTQQREKRVNLHDKENRSSSITCTGQMKRHGKALSLLPLGKCTLSGLLRSNMGACRWGWYIWQCGNQNKLQPREYLLCVCKTIIMLYFREVSEAAASLLAVRELTGRLIAEQSIHPDLLTWETRRDTPEVKAVWNFQKTGWNSCVQKD
mgnify:FL=1